MYILKYFLGCFFLFFFCLICFAKRLELTLKFILLLSQRNWLSWQNVIVIWNCEDKEFSYWSMKKLPQKLITIMIGFIFLSFAVQLFKSYPSMEEQVKNTIEIDRSIDGRLNSKFWKFLKFWKIKTYLKERKTHREKKTSN